MVIIDTKEINEYDCICLSFNYADELINNQVENVSNTTSYNSQNESLALTVIKPNTLATIKQAVKLTSRISFKSIVASIILTIANLFI